MVFSSVLFIVYFLPAFLLIYYLTPSQLKNAVILVGSAFFYMWGAPKFVGVILGSILLDYVLAQVIHNAEGRRRKLYLVLSVAVNVGILLYFKYSNFFVENLNAVLAEYGWKNISWTEVALPIGISFFTFHELSYIIDVYRGVKPPMKRLTDYAVYILLFPQLIAGPIIRYNEIADQIKDRAHRINVENAFLGFFRFIIGLSKKVLVANVLGEYVDYNYEASLGLMGTFDTWILVLAYTFQIYFDFSGYSDMAIGLARMMGFVFPENFSNPYISQSITEFWKRWHISLSRWMRDYLYIPLGGNRVSAARLYINLWIVFIISGFWHGAEWTFIAWGVYHGLFLVLERLFLLKLTAFIGKPLRILITFLLVVIGWVFFRAENMDTAISILQKMFVYVPGEELYPPSYKFVFVFCAAIVFCFMAGFKKVELAEERIYAHAGKLRSISIAAAVTCMLFLCMGELMSSSFNPFIYFRF